MSAHRSRKAYPLYLTGITLGVLLVCAFALYFIYGGSPKIGSIGWERVITAEARGPGGTPLEVRGGVPGAGPSASRGSGGEPSGVPAPGADQAGEVDPGDVASADSSPESADPAAPTAQPEARRPSAEDIFQRRLGEARVLATAKEWKKAIEAYDRLLQDYPGRDMLVVERARVIGWSGDNSGAADALGEALARNPGNAGLRFERARFLWWAGRVEEADLALDTVLAIDPWHAEALALRPQVRHSIEPTVERAWHWIELNDGPEERLALARAYVRMEGYVESLEHYERALARGTLPDTVWLEFARAAEKAEARQVAVRALETYLARVPDHRDARLALARNREAMGHFELALATYDELLSERPDPVLEAQRERVRKRVEPEPPLPPPAEPIAPIARWRVEGEAFGDSEDFRWLGTQASRSWGDARGAVEVRVRQAWLDGVSAANPGEADALGYGVTVEGQRRLREGVTLRARGGVFSFEPTGTQAVWGAGIGFERAGGGSVVVAYDHEPGVRRAVTAAALRAEVLADRVQVTIERPGQRWSLWSMLELEWLGSRLGSTNRASAAIAVGRPAGEHLWVSLGLGALATDGDSPVLEGWGPLYWSPVYYIAPQLGLNGRMSLGESVTLGLRAAPAYAFMNERNGANRRFDTTRTPALNAGIDLNVIRPSWELNVSGDWGGALESAYRSAVLRTRLSIYPSGR